MSEVCTFRIGPHRFGIDVEAMREVLEHWITTPVPLTPPCVLGVINLRGQIMMAIDLRRRVGIPDGDAGAQVCLVVHTADELVAFVVDRVGDVIEVREEHVEPPPETLPAGSHALIRGVYKLPDEIILLLDVACAADPGGEGPPRGSPQPDGRGRSP